jgi:transcriptional regulator with XRE-family HTH domain
MRAAHKQEYKPHLDTLLQRLQRNICYLRSELNLTIQEAAERAGMHWRHWQKIEAGKNNTTLETLTKIANCLGADPQELLGPELPPVRGKPTTKRRRQTRKKA